MPLSNADCAPVHSIQKASKNFLFTLQLIVYYQKLSAKILSPLEAGTKFLQE